MAKVKPKDVKNVWNLLKNGWKGLKTPGLRTGALAGAGTFFGFEWLTEGGMTNAVAGTFGISEGAASILMVAGALVVGGLILWYLFGRNKPATRTIRR